MRCAIALLATLGACGKPTNNETPPPLQPPAPDMITFAAGSFTGRATRCVDGTMTRRPTSGDAIQQLPAFRIDRKVVSCADFMRCVDAGACLYDAVCYGEIVDASQKAAEQYCRWRGAGLPSYLEWQRAARGKDGRTRAFGDDWDGTTCTRTGPTDFHRRRCAVVSTEGFELAVESPFSGEWTRDKDCGDRSSTPQQLFVDLRGDHLDESDVRPLTAEFRCAMPL